jgi:hypothetical protein
MPRFLIDLPMPVDPTDRLEDFLRKATAYKMQDDPVVQAAIDRVQGYLRERGPGQPAWTSKAPASREDSPCNP